MVVNAYTIIINWYHRVSDQYGLVCNIVDNPPNPFMIVPKQKGEYD